MYSSKDMALPVPPGTSPFHVKGTTYLAIVDYVRRMPGGIEAITPHLGDPALDAFLRQVFLPVAQYDALPIRPFADAIAACEKRPFAESVSERARGVAERDVTVMQRLLFKLVSPETILEDRLAKIALRYFDFGHASGRMVGAKRGEIRMEKIPTLLAPWFLGMLQGYVPFVLANAGARNPIVREVSTVRDGERAGLETSTLTCSVTWG